MENIFNDFSEKILVYCGIESENDPDEKSVDIDMLNAIPIRAIVSDLSFSKVKWIMPNVTESYVKEVLIESKHLPLILLSQKIKHDNINYSGWKENGKLQYRKEGAYIRFHMFSTND